MIVKAFNANFQPKEKMMIKLINSEKLDKGKYRITLEYNETDLDKFEDMGTVINNYDELSWRRFFKKLFNVFSSVWYL